MMDPRPKTDQPAEKSAPTTTAVPAKPVFAGTQPKGPDSGGNPSRDSNPKGPAPVSTQAKS